MLLENAGREPCCVICFFYNKIAEENVAEGENLMDDTCYNGLYSLLATMDFPFTSTIHELENPDSSIL